MRLLTILCFAIVFANPSFAQEKEQPTETTTYYFIRHAEKDRSDKTNRNPHLTDKGLLRAENWKNILSHVKFDRVYSTDYNRTKETASPTAKHNNLDITIYDPRSLDGKAFIKANKGKTVLIVGHSNTTPMFVNAILGEKKYEQIDDNNNGNLYIVTLSGDNKIDQLLVIN